MLYCTCCETRDLQQSVSQLAEDVHDVHEATIECEERLQALGFTVKSIWEQEKKNPRVHRKGNRRRALPLVELLG